MRPEDRRVVFEAADGSLISVSYWVLFFECYTKQEGLGVFLRYVTRSRWCLPFLGGKTSYDLITSSPNYSESPTFVVTLRVKIGAFPPMSVSVINSLQPSLRELISNKLQNHLTMCYRLQGLRIVEEYLRIISRIVLWYLLIL